MVGFFLVGVGGLSDSHIRFRSMGPFRYVRFKLRFLSFEPTNAPNQWFSSHPAHTIKKPTKMVGFFLVGVGGFEPPQA